MKAWRVYGRGDIRLDEVPIPVPKPGTVLLRIRMLQLSVTEASLLLEGDLAARKWEDRCREHGPLQMFGHEFCGEVVEVGAGVNDLMVGDRVFWGRMIPCGDCALCKAGYGALCLKGPHLGTDTSGCLAEYAIVPAGFLVKVPETVTDSEAAALEPLFATFVHVAAAGISIGDTVAILGQGVMGLNCLQLIRFLGAGKVIAVDIRGDILDLSRRLGADITVDASDCDSAESILDATNGVGADVVFDCAGGNPRFGLAGNATLATATRVVRDCGTIIVVGLQVSGGGGLDTAPLSRGVQYKSVRICSDKEVAWVVGLVASKRISLAPLITYTLEGIESVKQAFEMTANKRKYGAINPPQVRLV
ncbi:MAG: alcohol dehydrogenase catalytic domain-containing protein [Syntrophorhabdaceae bacterium]|nr:alcohol dehydrogenase catalytic domain-containing protein [Syntrophorhabdaceae bacterium]MDD5243336.1 alcohol dehydrogenase catalytic domain-containing protein [Syntrophorhabdaceae bacterium]